MSALTLTFSQLRYINKSFWRNPSAAFFIFAFPLMFLVIFTSLLGNNKVHISHLVVKSSTYYVAAMASFGVITACYTNIAITMSTQRDLGVLKRVDGSPLPKSSFMGSRVIHALLVGILLVVITAAFGHGFYSAAVPSGALLFRFASMLIVGAIAFCSLGLAITTVVPNVGRGTGHRASKHSSAPLPLRDFHPFRQHDPGMDPVDRPHLPGPPLRQRDVGRFCRHALRLGGCPRRRRLGPGRPLCAIRFFSWEPRV